MGLFVTFQQPPDEYANHLGGSATGAAAASAGTLAVADLVLLCLIPRAVMALRIPSVCPDGVLYIHIAQAIDAGDWRSGFRGMALNIYPDDPDGSCIVWGSTGSWRRRFGG